jgi:DNA-binding NarL/FixJ family response regulator
MRSRSDEWVTVLLVDDHAVVRAGYRRLLEDDSHLTVVAEAANSAEALQQDQELVPDVVVLDIALPGTNGIETLRRLRKRRPDARVLIFSMYDDAIYAARALSAGATGYISKSSAPDLLVEGVRSVARGQRYLSPDVIQALASMSSRKDELRSSLSPREREIVRLLSKGHDVEEISQKLGVSAKTVANLQTSVKRKFDVTTRVQLVMLARQLGLS